jgi:hypothetical protein
MVLNFIILDVLQKLIKKVAVGSKIIDLCMYSDTLIYE